MDYTGREEQRESEPLYKQRVTDSPDNSALIKAAAMSGAAYLSYRLLKTKKGLKALDSVGGFAYKIKNEILGPARLQVEDALVSGLPRGRQSERVVPELVRQLTDIFEKTESVGDRVFGFRHGNFGTGASLHREYLSLKFSDLTTDSGYIKATVSEFLSSKHISDSSRQVLERARRLGIVTDDMAVSSGRSFGLFKDETGRIINTEYMTGKSLFEAAHNFSRQFSILGTVRPADFIFGLAKPLIWNGDNLTIGSRTRLPDGTLTGSGLSYSLGGTIWSQVAGRREFELVGKNLKTYDLRTPGSRIYARAIKGFDGTLGREMDERLATTTGQTGGFKNWIKNLQRVVGFGHEYQTNRSIFADTFDVLERRDILRRTRKGDMSKGRWVPHDYVPRGSLFNEQERIKEELILKRQGIDPERYFQEAVPNTRKNYDDMTALEKAKAMVGKSPTGEFYYRPPSGTDPGLRVGRPHNPRRPTEGFIPAGQITQVPMGMHGLKSEGVPASGAVAEGGFLNTLGIVGQHMTERLNTLIGQTTGMGFSPVAGKAGWLFNLAKIYGIGATIKGGAELLKYTDYMAGEALDTIPGLDNTSPSEYAVEAFGKGLVALQQFRESTGIQQSAAYMEKLMPGSMTLPGMVAIRSLALPVMGFLRGGYIGGVAATAASLVIGGPGIEETSKETKDVIEGRKEVPIMKSRYWMMGLQPFGGNQIEYYRKHWIPTYLSNFRYTDTQYGSKEEYFKYESSLPTPHNLFGLRKLFSPDHYAEKHYANRPYPYAPSGKRMHEGEEITPTASEDAVAAMRLGYNADPGAYSTGKDPTGFGASIRRGTDQVTELFGIYKYFAEQMPLYDEMFGADGGDKHYAANASAIASSSREFYDQSIGGAVGMTELARRYMDVNKGKQGVNLIQNTMPSWLPGVASEFEGDRDYMIDFHLGDPYAKVPYGEARLPGSGYEALNALHSKIPGVYDVFDRYKILASVAPYSEAFKHYQTLVETMMSSGALDVSSMNEINQVENQIKSIQDGPEYTPRVFTGVISGTPEQIAIAAAMNPVERAIGGAWEMFTHDFVPGIGRAVPIVGTILDRKFFGQRSAYESYLEDQVYGVDFQNWSTPYESFIKPRAQNLIAHNPVSAAAGGFNMGLMLFGATTTGAAAGVLTGAGLSIASTSRIANSGQLSGGWIPDSFKERTELESYFDSLTYQRAEMNRQLAYDQGQMDLVLKYSKEARRTNVGMNMDLADRFFYTAARHRMGYPMKNYGSAFLNAPAESRAAIWEVSSPMAQNVLAESWKRQGDRRYSGNTASPKARSMDIISHYGIPNRDWKGWDPSVPMDIIKLRTLDTHYNKAYDMHKFNLWQSDRVDSNRSFREVRGAF